MALFEQTYPHIVEWVSTQGWVEIRSDGMSPSWARAIDEGGAVWEGGDPDQPLDDVLREMDDALGQWLEAQGDE